MPPASASATSPNVAALPAWARDLITLYESNASNQFILHGNVGDRMALPLGAQSELGSLSDFLLRALLPKFDVILSYDVGNGIRIEKGEKIFTQWPWYRDNPTLPKAPYNAIDILTHYFRFCGNLARLKEDQHIDIACILRAADLIMPGFQGGLSYELNAMALQVRDWSTETIFTEQPLAVFLIAENLNDLHPHLVNNNRVARVPIPLPTAQEMEAGMRLLAAACPAALGSDEALVTSMAQQLAGATLASVEGLLKTKQYTKEKISPDDLSKLKKQLVEKDCGGLIEFIDSTDSLDSLYGQEKIKEHLKQDIALWQKSDLDALPMGYLLCGPVGTGKTFMVRCLAGQAGVPVVKLKNFRDKWVGSSEGNLEKIFRLLHALGRCFVFVDEADQSLGKRDSGGEDSGVSGRLYSMMAEEMSNTRNRGKIIWILASSRPDLIEVDLKRPGRVDVKIPIFPTSTAAEGFALIRALCKRRGVVIAESDLASVEKMIPNWLTPGAAEALAVKVYRVSRTQSKTPLDALRECLEDYQAPVSLQVMKAQIQL
ncbi:MAG: ATP-binding protein, partial [Candidatus Sumerlaeota bacterium]|nr:ATP-binding protein [Candidatus Sumerlaeota bacterium]